MVGAAIQSIKQKRAEDFYLAPLGLNADTFLAQQREMSDGFVNLITSQIQNHSGTDVEALIVGCDDVRPHIYTVDHRGTVDCFDDVGFAAVGIGGWHARSRMMQAGYTNTFGYYSALVVAYAAKKSAEVAPGVGKATDIFLITKDGPPHPLPQDETSQLDALYQAYSSGQSALVAKSIKDLTDWGENYRATKRAGAK